MIGPDGERPDGWGPQRRVSRTRDGWRRWAPLVLLFVALSSQRFFTILLIGAAAVACWRVCGRSPWSRPASAERWRATSGVDPLSVVLAESRRLGGGVYLGLGPQGDWRLARSERAVLLLGPPRSGKTAGVVVPTVLAHDGPAVSTSTKPDVLLATAAIRCGWVACGALTRRAPARAPLKGWRSCGGRRWPARGRGMEPC